ncbi:prolyl oligopeptidase family serine peptidase [Rubripirellula sp.]|nr:prolyl oligopeptidase family serine peptidase [Rubripirellula sp.]
MRVCVHEVVWVAPSLFSLVEKPGVGMIFTYRWLTPSLWFAIVLICGPVYSQGTLQQYEKAASFASRTANRVYRDSVVPHWIGKSHTKFWYRISVGSGSHAYRLADCLTGECGPAFDHQKLASDLGQAIGNQVDPESLELSSIEFTESANRFSFRFADRDWNYSFDTLELREGRFATTGEDSDRLPALNVRPRSRDGGPRVSIRFENRSDKSLDYFWVKSDGSLQRYGLVEPGKRVELSTFAGHAWLLTDQEGRATAAFIASEETSRAVIDDATPQPIARRPARPRDDRNRSPDGKWTVSYDDKTVSVANVDSGETADFQWSSIREDFGVSGCEVDRIWWSPDSRHFVMLPSVVIDQREIAIVESSPDHSVHPELHQFRYVKPGDPLAKPWPTLFSLDHQWKPRVIDDSLFSNPFSISRLAWTGDSGSFSFLYNQRGHQRLSLIVIDALTAKARIGIDEVSDTFVCYSQKSYLHHLEATDEWIWMSERSGWNHLYLIDSKTGLIKNPITSGDWVVRSVEKVDEVNRQVLLTVSGIQADEDPYHQHLIRVDLDGQNLVRLTEGDGDHRWRFSPNGEWLIDSYSRVDLPPVTVLRSGITGKWICDLETADIGDLLETGWRCPERFVAMGRDGVTPIHGIIIRPTHFQPNKKYPVLEHIYAGPHSAFVPKQFGLHRQLYEMAELGFIVVKIDGMGTSHRSKAFHDVCWKNLGDSGFPDRISWMQSASIERPEMDLERVGIWGGSAGGQSAMRALIAHGDFYKAASADCGCHDNRVDKIWWNEQWMGWPIGDHYEQQSNVSQAHRMKGDLLLIWGELDRNVDPASSMQVVDALIRSDKDFTQLIVPGAGHGAASHPYAKRRQADFFVRKLWGSEPRSQ